MQVHHEIYLPEMHVPKDNATPKSVLLLDLDSSIIQNKFCKNNQISK